MSELYEDICTGLEEAIAFEQGDPETTSGTVVKKMKVAPVPDFSSKEIKEIRLKPSQKKIEKGSAPMKKLLLILSVFFCAPAFRKVMGNTERKRPAINIVVCVLIFVLSVGFLVSGSFNPFLYFRF